MPGGAAALRAQQQAGQQPLKQHREGAREYLGGGPDCNTCARLHYPARFQGSLETAIPMKSAAHRCTSTASRVAAGGTLQLAWPQPVSWKCQTRLSQTESKFERKAKNLCKMPVF